MTEHRPPSALLVLLALLLRTARPSSSIRRRLGFSARGLDKSSTGRAVGQDRRDLVRLDGEFEVGIRDCPDAQVVVGVECASTNCN